MITNNNCYVFFLINYLGDEKFAGNGKNCWQNCIQIIIEDSIGSHAKKVSRKDLENNLKKYFWKI